jgi:hypothetical protein
MQIELVEKKTFKHALVQVVKSHPETAVVTATATYIPLEQFQEIFNYIGTLATREGIKKLIFDKRELSVFHQPSMEWYFIEWKEKMFDVGLKIHRKILPSDEVFRHSVKIGREKINKSHPNGKYKLMDIRYYETLEEAVHN